MTKRIRKGAVLLLGVLCAAALALGMLLGSFSAGISVNAESSSAAYLLHMDYGTRGMWYIGEKGTIPENRIYGKSGVVWIYEKCFEDGQPITDVATLNDFSEESAANYVEYPEWVTSVTGDIQSWDDKPHGYWNNSQLPAESVAQSQDVYPNIIKRLLPLDPTEIDIAHTACVFTKEDVNFTVTVSDNEWHRVSAYIGNPYQGNNNYACSDLFILGPGGETLAYASVEDVNHGVWVSFAVRGSFTIRLDEAGWGEGAFNMIAFDEFETDEEIGRSNLQATVQDARNVALSWENADSTSITNIYRREQGEDVWNLVAVAEPGATSYLDTETSVARTYEYMIGCGTPRTYTDKDDFYGWKCVPDVADCNLPDEANAVTVSTAAYSLTYIEFDKASYEADYGKSVSLRVTVYRQQEGGEEYVPYAGVPVTFTLGGDPAYHVQDGQDTPNMQTDLGTYTSNANGQVRFNWKQEYAGEYTITASIAIVADETDPEHGTDGSSATVSFAQHRQETVASPYIANVTDAVKPGDAVTLSGNNLLVNDDFRVAYAPNTGKEAGAFTPSAPPAGCKYLEAEDMLVTDGTYRSGVMFIFPETEKAGSYDFWIETSAGWSNGITMNAARPLYINQDGAYAGVQIEVVGRNFFLSDFGIGTEESARDNVKVRLSSSENSYDIGVLTGVRIPAEESNMNLIKGEDHAKVQDIMHTNPYRLTFEVPSYVLPGKYEVYVAADGKDFRKLDSGQTITVYEKKSAEWDETVFGPISGSGRNGNDPLGLGVYWAQDLNYLNVETAVPNEAPGDSLSAVSAYTSDLNSKISALSAKGGGVLYFPAGEYYIGGLRLNSGVMLVGAGADKTTLYYVGTGGSAWIRGDGNAQTSSSNIGVARIAFELYQYSGGNPDMIISFAESSGGSQSNDISIRSSQNKFVTDCTFRFSTQLDVDGTNARGLVQLNGNKNILYQNVEYHGGASPLLGSYHNEYMIVRNLVGYMVGTSQTVSATGRYTFFENVWVESGWQGHGYALRSYAYIGDSYITKTGDTDTRANIGEMILFEPPGGYFATGNILAATENTFTVDRRGGQNINEQSRLDYNRFAVYITDGTGAGQLRYFEKAPLNTYGNEYRLAGGEDEWDIIPDSTSKYTIISPMVGDTVYRFQANDCKKALFLYNNMFDALVAECNLWDTEGISLFAGDVSDERFCPSMGVRIENNVTRGISPLTGKGGIAVRSERSASRASNGAQIMNVVIRGNTVLDAKLKDGETLADYIGSSETPDPHGITICSQSTTGQDTSGDIRFVTIENNVIDNCEFGIWCDNRITGIVARGNSIGDVQAEDKITYYSPSELVILAEHTLYVNGEVSDLSGEYRYGTDLPVPVSEDGSTFFGWSLTEEYDPDTPVTEKALGADSTLYALFGREVVFDLNYDRASGSVFNTIRVMSGYTVAEEMAAFGNPFRVGYDFGGWYLDKECTQAFDASVPVDSSFTVYAKWTDKNAAEQPSGEETEGEAGGGCSGSVSAVGMLIGGIAAAAAIAALCLKKRNV